MTKDELRTLAMKRRNSLLPGEIEIKSKKIFSCLKNNESYICAKNVLIYASMRSEVITDSIIEDGLKRGKMVFCPKVTDRKTGSMEFIRISSLEDLKEGYFKIREPLMDKNSVIYSGDDIEETIMIMPLVAFDDHRNRIGYSGGFYDRYLQRYPDLSSVAIAFMCQRTDDSIPAMAHDVKPGMIITEEICFK